MSLHSKKDRLRQLALARKRPPYKKMATLDASAISLFLDFYQRHKQHNILRQALADRADRNLEIDDTAYLSQNYLQVELQSLRPGSQPAVTNYTEPRDTVLINQLEKLIGACYRTRISVLKPTGIIRRHIDDPRQLRVICVLQGEHIFQLFLKQGALEIPMQPGELWLVNTAWEHEVINKGSIDRIALLSNLFESPEQAE